MAVYNSQSSESYFEYSHTKNVNWSHRKSVTKDVCARVFLAFVLVCLNSAFLRVFFFLFSFGFVNRSLCVLISVKTWQHYHQRNFALHAFHKFDRCKSGDLFIECSIPFRQYKPTTEITAAAGSGRTGAKRHFKLYKKSKSSKKPAQHTNVYTIQRQSIMKEKKK